MANTHDVLEAVGGRLDWPPADGAAPLQFSKTWSHFLYYEGRLAAEKEECMRLIERFERFKEATPELERAQAAGKWEVE